MDLETYRVCEILGSNERVISWNFGTYSIKAPTRLKGLMDKRPWFSNQFANVFPCAMYLFRGFGKNSVCEASHFPAESTEMSRSWNLGKCSLPRFHVGGRPKGTN
jgi:hypothetical protein